MSNNNIIDLTGEIVNNGWRIDWNFNEAIDLYKYNGCTTIDSCKAINTSYKTDLSANGEWFYHLGSLTSAHRMFMECAGLTSFSGDLSSLQGGWQMFRACPNLISFSGDLLRMTSGSEMFYQSAALTSFNSNLPSMTNGSYMFFGCTNLTSFSGDLSSLTEGNRMFVQTALTSFSGDLPNLTNGENMFRACPNLISFSGDLSSLTDGRYMFCETPLTSFNSNLSSLTAGTGMFGNTAENACPLSEESIMNIANTIQDINDLGLTGDNGQLWLGYDTSITDTTNIMNCCDRIADKGWTVYLNGTLYVKTTE